MNHRNSRPAVNSLFSKLFCLTVLMVWAHFSSAVEFPAGKLLIVNPAIPAIPPGASVAAGYLEIVNHSDKPDRLIAVDVAFAVRSEIHEVTMTDDVAKMRELQEPLEIGPGETVKLESGSFHLMFMGVSESLVIGELRSVTLIFEEAGSYTVPFEVVDRRLSQAKMKHGDMKHEGMKHEGMKHEGMTTGKVVH